MPSVGLVEHLTALQGDSGVWAVARAQAVTPAVGWLLAKSMAWGRMQEYCECGGELLDGACTACGREFTGAYGLSARLDVDGFEYLADTGLLVMPGPTTGMTSAGFGEDHQKEGAEERGYDPFGEWYDT